MASKIRDKKSILLIHSSSDLYGASKILCEVVKILKLKYTIIVVLPSVGPLEQVLRDLNVEVHIIKLGILRRKYFNIVGIINRARRLLFAYNSIAQIIRENNIDVIYSNTSGVLVGALLAKFRKITHIWHLHEIIEKPRIFSVIMGKIINSCSDKVIVVSDEVKEFWSARVDRDKMVRIYNGIDYSPYLEPGSTIREELALSEDTIIIGMVARVNQWKGQSYFIEIAKHLAEKNSNLVFVLAGDAFPGFEYLEVELAGIIESSGISSRIFNLGYRADSNNILKGCDIVFLPSILPDPLPTVVLEAMGSGKPVVATFQGGAKEMVVNNETGIFIPIGNSEKAAELTIPLIFDQEMRIQMGSAGRKRALDMFSSNNFEANLLNVLAQV